MGFTSLGFFTYTHYGCVSAIHIQIHRESIDSDMHCILHSSHSNVAELNFTKMYSCSYCCGQIIFNQNIGLNSYCSCTCNKYEKHFQKMYRDVGMAVPKTTETRCRDGSVQGRHVIQRLHN